MLCGFFFNMGALNHFTFNAVLLVILFFYTLSERMLNRSEIMVEPGLSMSKEAATKNDNSNPQQGTGSRAPAAPAAQPVPVIQAPSFKPTEKDARKLFVGGLPSDGTYYGLAIFWVEQLIDWINQC
jgi:hypothetical protein